MKSQAFLAQSGAESRMMLRRREVVFFSILLPTMFMLLFGSIFGNTVDQESGVKVISFLLPGYMVMAIMSVALISLGIMTANERQNGVLKRLGATPLPRALLLLGKMVSISFVIIIAVVLLLAIGVSFFGVTIRGNPIEIALILVIGIAVFAILGLMIGGMVKAEAAPAILNAIYFPLLFLGGAILPLSQLPDWLQQFGKLLPSYHLTNLLIEVMALGHPVADSWGNLLALLVWGAGSLAVAARTFKWE
ncbi:MAG: ABC transporter permease [Chloroflexia bacterium]